MSSAAVAPFSFTLDEQSAKQVDELSRETGLSAERLIGVALQMFSLAAEAKKSNRRMIIASNWGYPIKEVVIPEK